MTKRKLVSVIRNVKLGRTPWWYITIWKDGNIWKYSGSLSKHRGKLGNREYANDRIMMTLAETEALLDRKWKFWMEEKGAAK